MKWLAPTRAVCWCSCLTQQYRTFVWDQNVAPLAAAGFRVIRYDLCGRGLSDRIDGRYDFELFTRQLAELLTALVPDQPAALVGVSLGGMIISEYAQRRGDRVSALVLIDPAGVGTDLPLVAKAALAPGLGEYLMRVVGSRQLRPARRMLLHPEQYPAFDSLYLSTLSIKAIKGSRRAVLSTLRTVPFTGYETKFREIGRSDLPVLLIWGEQDGIVPFDHHAAIRELVRPRQFTPIANAGHLPNYERPDLVNSAIIAFLQQWER